MTQMDMIKNELSEHIGKEVIVKANRGRKRIVTRRGVLTAVYPSLFFIPHSINHVNYRKRKSLLNPR